MQFNLIEGFKEIKGKTFSKSYFSILNQQLNAGQFSTCQMWNGTTSRKECLNSGQQIDILEGMDDIFDLTISLDKLVEKYDF